MARILIVEDEPHIVRVLSMWLRRHGHETVEACNGAQALAAIESASVDLIISDVNMPQLDGLGLLRAMRKDKGLSTPILLLSARCDQADIARQVGAEGVQLYPKPFIPSRLVTEIDRILAAAAT